MAIASANMREAPGSASNNNSSHVVGGVTANVTSSAASVTANAVATSDKL